MITSLKSAFDAMSLLSRVCAVLAAVLLVAGVVTLIGWSMGAGDRQKAAQADAEATMAGARTKAAGDAVRAADEAAKGAAADEQATRDNTDAIRGAPGADKPVAPAVADKGRRRICQRQSAAADPSCKRYRE